MHTNTTSQPVRTDSLTGIGNLLGFADLLLDERQAGGSRSLIALDLNGLSRLERGHGDSVLRWVALVLREELPAPVFRIGTDDFAALLDGPARADHHGLVIHLAARLSHEADRLGLHQPAVALCLIHYRGDEPRSPADILGQIQAGLSAAKRNLDAPVTVLEATDLSARVDLRSVANRLVDRLVSLGGLLETSQQLANTDPVTGLPNSRAALQRLDQALDHAAASQQPFAVLQIDGDNLRRYNESGYAAGDRMLLDLAATLREQLRPSDFLARWRIGDEFFVLLPQTGVSGAATLAERLRRRVELVSQYWPFPVTISIGIAAYPQHGEGDDELIDRAEEAKDRAKAAGKNRVIIADNPTSI